MELFLYSTMYDPDEVLNSSSPFTPMPLNTGPTLHLLPAFSTRPFRSDIPRIPADLTQTFPSARLRKVHSWRHHAVLVYPYFRYCCVCLFLARQLPHWTRASPFARFLDHTQRRNTVGRTPLDEWSARRRDVYLTTHTADRHSCPRRDSNPQSQQASGRRPTPLTARATGTGCRHCTRPITKLNVYRTIN